MNPTQVVGLVACLIAALLCARAARRSSAARGLWGGLTALYGLLTLDLAFDLRMALRGWLVEAAKQAGDYGLRREVQPLLLAALALAALLGAWLLLRRLGDAPARGAALGAAASLAVVATEVVSLHAVDAVLYRPLGPVMLIAWVWSGCAALVSFSALAAARR